MQGSNKTLLFPVFDIAKNFKQLKCPLVFQETLAK